ncbi:LOW QUALITY PROTEIN: uncharacterized protein LOC114871575 [Osmia bicornis bicornis]|uniref:LOW QUALITY PROTEIN: uncharacterized protein LOC114871575 n=1 Tax=Osmia bicornis bicornis TaxID=1437191 RepID=UPI0010F48E43|nr:LOW QUALITY PROTEIN: uncharacterized protein LOC114871575 [Osmia bicornis bicornis]
MKFLKKRREEKERALYVRLPHVIREEEDVAKLFTGDFKVNLPRQSTRYCYVIFPDTESKLKNLKEARNTQINGKPIVVAPAITKFEKNRKLKRKKIVIPKVKDETRVTRTLFVSNIALETKSQELKAAIQGCESVKMLKPHSEKCRSAMVKMEDVWKAADYILKRIDRPIVRGRRLRFNPDTRTRHRPKKTGPLKIYDGETEIKAKPEEKKSLIRERKRRFTQVLGHIENKTGS